MTADQNIDEVWSAGHMGHAEIHYPRLLGQTVRTAIWRDQTASDKRPLLFFNGIGANMELVAPLGRMIQDRDIITLDVPGIGESPAPNFPYRPWQLARLSRAVLDFYGVDDVDVMGVSWGGAMAQQFAFQYRNRVRKVILCATSTGVTMVPGQVASLSKMRDPKRYTDPNFMRENFKDLYGDDHDHADGHAAALKPPTMKGYMFQMLAMAGWSSIPFLPFVKQPVLILAGDRDRIVPTINAKIIDRFLPNSRISIVEDGGHLFLVSKADVVLPQIVDFLDEIDQVPESA